jgi:hypothetical protein
MDSSPYVKVWQIATGYLLPRCLHVVAELGVADHLGDEPMTADALAAATGTNADVLERVLRPLAVAGVFEQRGGRWAHTDLSRLIRSDHPQSLRAFVRLYGGRQFWFAFGELGHALRTGKPVVDKFVPGGTWAYLRDHPEVARGFDAAMQSIAGEEFGALLSAFDFTRYGVVADVGGGRGHVLAAVLAAAPAAQGILFDQPAVVADLPPQPRMIVKSGDFFSDPLPAADAYILGRVLHNWDDGHAQAILRAIRNVAPAHAELLVLEAMIPDGPEPHPSKILDLVMLTFTSGRERTRQDYEVLLAAGGFRLERTVTAGGGTSMIVGVPV